jgi:hypothetical protein
MSSEDLENLCGLALSHCVAIVQSCYITIALFISRPGSTGLGSLEYLKFHYGSIGESVYCEEYIAGFFSG